MGPLEYAEQICYSSKEVLMFTHEMAVKLADTEGVYVECGVAAGAQIIAMIAGAPYKLIYAFDSFEGIPLPSNRDDQMPGIRGLKEWEQKSLPDPGKQQLVTSGATIVSVENFYENLYGAFGVRDFLNLITIPGWFEITVSLYADIMGDIALLRLDGDLYNSTFVCLQHLFPKVVSGGVVIIDDWTLKGCQDACKEYFELIGYEPNYQFLGTTSYFTK